MYSHVMCVCVCVWLQTGEYATDEEEEEEEAGPAVDRARDGKGDGEKSIEVFDLPEADDIISPSELDATKLYQKFREVTSLPLSLSLFLYFFPFTTLKKDRRSQKKGLTINVFSSP